MKGEKELRELLRQFVPYVQMVSEQLHKVIDKLSPKEAADLIIHVEAVDDLGMDLAVLDGQELTSEYLRATAGKVFHFMAIFASIFETAYPENENFMAFSSVIKSTGVAVCAILQRAADLMETTYQIDKSQSN